MALAEVWQHRPTDKGAAQVIDFDGAVDLYHFYLLRAVGKGAFGKVRVVQHKQTKVGRGRGGCAYVHQRC